MKDDIKWLECWREPWSEVLEKWRNTFSIRKIQSGDAAVTTIHEYFKQWPILNDSRSESLVGSIFIYFMTY